VQHIRRRIATEGIAAVEHNREMIDAVPGCGEEISTEEILFFPPPECWQV
jgi:hypothetical protein